MYVYNLWIITFYNSCILELARELSLAYGTFVFVYEWQDSKIDSKDYKIQQCSYILCFNPVHILVKEYNFQTLSFGGSKTFETFVLFIWCWKKVKEWDREASSWWTINNPKFIWKFQTRVWRQEMDSVNQKATASLDLWDTAG